MLLRATEALQPIPEADVVCYGLWADPAQSSHHGVFVMNRNTPTKLDFMLQKPTTEEQGRLLPTHLMLMDIGVWLLSDKAVKRLMQKTAAAPCAPSRCTPAGHSLPLPQAYDLYSELDVPWAKILRPLIRYCRIFPWPFFPSLVENFTTMARAKI